MVFNVSILVELTMKKTILFLLLLMSMNFGSGNLLAKDRGAHKFEIGAGADNFGILGMLGGPAHYPGPRAFFEYRYFITDGLDAGINLSYQFHTAEGNPTPGNPVIRFVNHMPSISALSEYVFCPGRKVRPFLGAGIGLGINYKKYDTGSEYNQYYGMLYPRFGVEFFGHLRLSVELRYAWTDRFYSYESSKGISLSWVF